tara:strand:+ start:2001 stop:3410 length:1410 start_codon:yes stop_codon:yes gene_type:complete
MQFFSKLKKYFMARWYHYSTKYYFTKAYWKNLTVHQILFMRRAYFKNLVSSRVSSGQNKDYIKKNKIKISEIMIQLSKSQNIFRSLNFYYFLKLKKNEVKENDNKYYIDKSLLWLFRGLKKRNLISAAYNCRYGWLPGYPETNGYILETLINLLSKNYKFPKLEENTKKIYKNLVKLQNLKEGHFLSGYDGTDPTNFHGKKSPSVFNTSQILIGLMNCYTHFKDKNLLKNIELSTKYISSCLDDKGYFIKGFSPGPKSKIRSYYVKNSSILLEASVLLNNQKIENLAKKSLEYYTNFLTKEYWVKDAGFFPDENPLTHNLAYYVEGYWKAYKLTQNNKYLEISLNIVNKVCNIFESNNGFLKASFSSDWKSNDNYCCVVGLAQFSNLALEIGFELNDYWLINSGMKMLDELKKIQYLKTPIIFKNFYGALPASHPIYGTYSFMSLVNWSSKYYIDTLINENNILNKLND